MNILPSQNAFSKINFREGVFIVLTNSQTGEQGFPVCEAHDACGLDFFDCKGHGFAFDVEFHRLFFLGFQQFKAKQPLFHVFAPDVEHF